MHSYRMKATAVSLRVLAQFPDINNGTDIVNKLEVIVDRLH